MKRITTVLALLITAGLILLAAYLFLPHPVSIGKVLERASEWDGKSVVVRGRVTEGMDIFGYGAYRLEDGTGAIWVVTNQGTPNIGANVIVMGKVHKVFQIGKMRATTLEELRRR